MIASAWKSGASARPGSGRVQAAQVDSVISASICRFFGTSSRISVSVPGSSLPPVRTM